MARELQDRSPEHLLIKVADVAKKRSLSGTINLNVSAKVLEVEKSATRPKKGNDLTIRYWLHDPAEPLPPGSYPIELQKGMVYRDYLFKAGKQNYSPKAASGSFVPVLHSEPERAIRQFVRCMSTRDVESLRSVVQPGFMGIEAGQTNVHVLDTTNVKKLLDTQKEGCWENAIVSDVKSEISSTHPSIATASFILTVPLSETQLSQMQEMLISKVMPLDDYQRQSVKKAIKAKRISASMFAILGKSKGQWKIMSITLP